MTPENEYITSGNIEGAAKVARQIARENGLKITLYNYRSGLGFYQALNDIMIKNRRMVEACNFAYVVWDGESKGTKREIEMLKKHGKHYELFLHNKNKLIDVDALEL